MNSYGFPLILSWPRWPLQVLVSALVTAIFDRLSPVAAALDADVSLRSTGPRTFSPKKEVFGREGSHLAQVLRKTGDFWWDFMGFNADFLGFHGNVMDFHGEKLWFHGISSDLNERNDNLVEFKRSKMMIFWDLAKKNC